MQQALAEPEVAGGPAKLVDALASAARAAGAEICTAVRATAIEIDDGGRVCAVRLADGERLETRAFIACCHPRRALFDLVGKRHLTPALARDVASLRGRGIVAKVHLGLSGPLALVDGTEVEALRTGETLDDLEKAFDAVKYQTYASAPVLDVRVPSMSDPSLAPHDGHHVVSIAALGAPRDLEGGWSAMARDDFTDRVIAELGRHCPTLPSRIVARELLTPLDLEERYDLPGGNLQHLEPAIDQLLFMRPTVDTAKYATPIAGLYLGARGSHPGLGIGCAAGMLAARALLSRR
jgi:phytoene dehydrogenase-like protein